jgi:uncharacterized membrane protein
MTKTVKLVFLVSLVLNILLLGVILGHVPRSLEGRPSRQERMEKALQELPDSVEARFREKFQQIRAAGEPQRQQMDSARAEALRLLGGEPFDEAAYDQQVSKIDGLREEMFKRMGQVVKQTAKELTPEERRMFADLLRRPPPPPRGN